MSNNGSSAKPDASAFPAPFRLKDMKTHAVGLVDEAANGWTWLSIRKSLRGGTGMRGVKKALQMPTGTKDAIAQVVTAAQEDLNTILMTVQGAEETDGSPMPMDLLGAIEQTAMALMTQVEQFEHGGEGGGGAGAGGADMTDAETEMANAVAAQITAGANDIAKAVVRRLKASGRIAKAAAKLAPTQMVGLIKELLDEFFARHAKWGGMLASEGGPVAAPDAGGATAKDASAKLKDVQNRAQERMRKSRSGDGSGEGGAAAATEEAIAALAAIPGMAPFAKALGGIAGMEQRLEKLQKALIGDGALPTDDRPAGGGRDTAERKYSYGENIAATRKAARAKEAARGGARRRDEEDEEDFEDD